MIVVAIIMIFSTMSMIVVRNLYLGYWQNLGRSDIARSFYTLSNVLGRDVHSSIGTVEKWDTKISGKDCLILKIPSKPQTLLTQNVNYDYIVYLQENNNLIKRIFVNKSSTRKPGTSIICRNLKELSFTCRKYKNQNQVIDCEVTYGFTYSKKEYIKSFKFTYGLRKHEEK